VRQGGLLTDADDLLAWARDDRVVLAVDGDVIE
jgi:hypothetical protein